MARGPRQRKASASENNADEGHRREGGAHREFGSDSAPVLLLLVPLLALVVVVVVVVLMLLLLIKFACFFYLFPRALCIAAGVPLHAEPALPPTTFTVHFFIFKTSPAVGPTQELGLLGGSLRRLNLGFNCLTGALPVELAGLTRLTHLRCALPPRSPFLSLSSSLYSPSLFFSLFLFWWLATRRLVLTFRP